MLFGSIALLRVQHSSIRRTGSRAVPAKRLHWLNTTGCTTYAKCAPFGTCIVLQLQKYARLVKILPIRRAAPPEQGILGNLRSYLERGRSCRAEMRAVRMPSLWGTLEVDGFTETSRSGFGVCRLAAGTDNGVCPSECTNDGAGKSLLSHDEGRLRKHAHVGIPWMLPAKHAGESPGCGAAPILLRAAHCGYCCPAVAHNFQSSPSGR